MPCFQHDIVAKRKSILPSKSARGLFIDMSAKGNIRVTGGFAVEHRHRVPYTCLPLRHTINTPFGVKESICYTVRVRHHRSTRQGQCWPRCRGNRNRHESWGIRDPGRSLLKPIFEITWTRTTPRDVCYQVNLLRLSVNRCWRLRGKQDGREMGNTSRKQREPVPPQRAPRASPPLWGAPPWERRARRTQPRRRPMTSRG